MRCLSPEVLPSFTAVFEQASVRVTTNGVLLTLTLTLAPTPTPNPTPTPTPTLPLTLPLTRRRLVVRVGYLHLLHLARRQVVALGHLVTTPSHLHLLHLARRQVGALGHLATTPSHFTYFTSPVVRWVP